MRIVCPACETGYQVADGTLGVTGRKVRCARCGTVWHAAPNDYPEAPQPAPAARPAPATPEPSEDEWRDAIAGEGAQSTFDKETAGPADEGNDQSAIDDLFASGPTEEADAEAADRGNDQSAVDDLFAAGPVEAEPPTDEPPTDEPAEAGAADEAPTIDAPPAGFGSSRKTRDKAKRRGASTLGLIDRHLSTPVASVLLVGFLVLFCGAAVVGRETVVRLLPDFAGIYELLGLKVNLRGLDFSEVTAHREMDGSTPVLVVEGDIVNLDDRSKPLPAVRVTLKSSTDRDVYAWNYMLPQLNIDQRGKVRFKTRLLAPPEASVSVEVRFTDTRPP